MSASPVVFSATGTVQSFVVPATGTYVIEAAGGEGGDSATPGLKGAQVSGMFHLRRSEILRIVAGRQGAPASAPHLPGSRGGSSLVWSGLADLPNPIKLLLSARGGAGGLPATTSPAAAGGSNDAVIAAAELHAGVSGLDRPTADSLATVWTAGGGSAAASSAGGAGVSDRCGYNAGAFRRNTPDIQTGHGAVSIRPVNIAPATPAPVAPEQPAEIPAAASVPAPSAKPPSASDAPPVTPRPGSWTKLLRRPPGQQ